MNLYIISIIIILFTATVITRFLPFIFTKKFSESSRLQVLGPKLPAHIMMLLLIYQLNPKELFEYPRIAITLVSLSLVVISHKFLRKPLISICLGTFCYSLGWFLLK